MTYLTISRLLSFLLYSNVLLVEYLYNFNFFYLPLISCSLFYSASRKCPSAFRIQTNCLQSLKAYAAYLSSPAATLPSIRYRSSSASIHTQMHFSLFSSRRPLGEGVGHGEGSKLLSRTRKNCCRKVMFLQMVYISEALSTFFSKFHKMLILL